MSEPQVDALFRWYKGVEIMGRKFWLRILGAADDGARSKGALQVSRALRARLFTEGSPEQSDLLSGLKGLTRENILAVARVYYTETARNQSLSEVQPKIDPPEPLEPSLDAVMDSMDEWDAEVAGLRVRRDEYVLEYVEVYMSKLDDLDDEALLERVLDIEISTACSTAYMEEFGWQTTYRAYFNDEGLTERTFPTVEDARDCESKVFQRMLAEYGDLDVFSLKAEDLKN